MTAVYLGRDNKVSLRLLVNNATVTADTVTKAQLLIPGAFTVSGNDLLLDSSVDAELTLTDSATVVNVIAGDLALKAGLANCYLTIFDANNTDGLAWARVPIRVLPWLP